MAKKVSTRIEPGIARVDRLGRRPIYRVQLSGRKVGGRRLNRDCATYAEAQDIKRIWLETGGAPLGEAPRDDGPEATVEDGLRAYVDDLKARRKGYQRARQVIRALRTTAPDVLGQPISQLTVAALYGYRQAREDIGIKANTIIRELRVVRAMLKQARPDFRVPAAVFPPENLTRVRVLQPDDEARVFPRLREPFRTMARLAALTLMRQGNLRTLEVDMVHLPQGLILLPRTKTGPRPVILGDEAAELLARQIATLPPGARYVFPKPPGGPYAKRHVGQPYSAAHVWRVWHRAAVAAGLRSFTFHDLKHHGATVALNAGASDAILMQLGGWTRPDQIRRYASAVSGRMREAANAIAKGLQHEHHPPA